MFVKEMKTMKDNELRRLSKSKVYKCQRAFLTIIPLNKSIFRGSAIICLFLYVSAVFALLLCFEFIKPIFVF